MFTSRLVLPGLLLLGAALAAPAPDKAAVDETTISTTIAAATTTLSGTSSVVGTNAAKPVPTNGAIQACHNTDGEFKPFCMPKNNQVYWVWSTHHITWDPSFFEPNTALKVMGVYTTNETTIPDSAPHHGEEEAFSSEEIDSGWGIYQWRPNKHILTDRRIGAANITIRIVALPSKGQQAQWLTGPVIQLMWKPKPPAKPKPVKNDTQALYIALPLVFGFATLMIVGTFFWNRQIRQIGVGSIMGRSRRLERKRGVLGVSKKDRARNTNKEQNIRLMEHGSGSNGSDREDWDEGWSHEVPGSKAGRKQA